MVEPPTKDPDRPCLPPELWDKLFSYLDEPRDLLYAMRTCTEWEDALRSRKQTILLQNVFPLVAKYLPAPTVLECRGVCTQLKSLIDKSIERSHPCSTQENFELSWINEYTYNCVHPDLPGIVDWRYKFVFLCPAAMKWKGLPKFVDHMKSHNCNPFVGRSMSLTIIPGWRPFEYFVENGMPLFTRFGDQLWHFVYQCPETATHPFLPQVMLHLPSLLKLLPNLRSFEIKWNPNGPHLAAARTDIEEFFRTCQFTPLRKLVTLHYSFEDNYSIFPAMLGNCLLRTYGAQLTTFICRADFFQDDAISVDTLNRLENLRNLRMTGVTSGAVLKLCEVTWNLERLHLQGVFGNLTYPDLVNVMNHFQNTLVHLNIQDVLNCTWLQDSGVDVQPEPEHPKWSIELSNLKHVICVKENINDIVFWNMVRLKLTNLEVLDFQHFLDLNEIERECMEGRLERKFFEWFPKLEKIRFWYGCPFPNRFLVKQHIHK